MLLILKEKEEGKGESEKERKKGSDRKKENHSKYLIDILIIDHEGRERNVGLNNI